MKAVYIERFGRPEVLKYGDLADPIAAPGEAVVDVVAASINAADRKVRAGQNPQTKFPFALGRDFSGLVSALGAGVTDFKVGDAVFGVCATGQKGAYAEKIAVSAAIIAKKPDGLSHINAAALALTGLTAVTTIEDTLKLQRGERILIHGGAGGVASFAVQLAKHIGAHVITTASAANHDYVRGLGADEIIDYNGVDFAEVVSNSDAVFDTVGGEVAQRSFAVLKPGGALPLSHPARRRRIPTETMSSHSGLRSDAPVDILIVSPNCFRRASYALLKSSSIAYSRPSMPTD